MPLTSFQVSAFLKGHRQIFKKWPFEKYCSCDKACPFSALEGAL